MTEAWEQIQGYVTLEHSLSWVRAALLIVVGWLLARLLSGTMQRLTEGRLEPTQAALFRRATYYLVLTIFLVAALHQLGFNLGVLLGAAGILSVAVGFASQTSASNLISGLFLIAERPFAIGDIVQVSGTTGEVLSVDLLSVKLRTFDNLFVRIPNETLIKTEVRTLTRFPIRRADLQIGIAYKEDIERVRDLLFEIADRLPLCLNEPKPQFILLGFGDSAIQIQFSPWALKANFLELRNLMHQEIKKAFDREGIEIAFPHRSLYAGSATEPIPVKLVESTPSGSPIDAPAAP